MICCVKTVQSRPSLFKVVTQRLVVIIDRRLFYYYLAVEEGTNKGCLRTQNSEDFIYTATEARSLALYTVQSVVGIADCCRED